MSSRKRLRSARSGNAYCIACGQVVAEQDAYNYRHGDEREDQQFESLCPSCYHEYSNLPRDGLEEVLVEVGAGTVDDTAFVQRYFERIEQ